MAVTRLLQHKGKPLGRKGSDCSAHIPGKCEDHEHFLVGSDPLKKKMQALYCVQARTQMKLAVKIGALGSKDLVQGLPRPHSLLH